MVNRVVDALNRRPQIFSMMPLKTNLREKLLDLQFKDTWYQEVRKSLREDEMRVPKYEEYSLDNDGLLRFWERIYVPSNEDILQLILNEAHRTDTWNTLMLRR